MYAEFTAKSISRIEQGIAFENGKIVSIGMSVMFEGYRNMDSQQANAFYQRIEDMMIRMNAESPPGVNNGFQTSYDNWPWLYMRSSFIRYAN